MTLARCPASAGESLPPEARGAAGLQVLDVWFPERIGLSFPDRGAWLPVYVELRATTPEPQKWLLLGNTEVLGKRWSGARDWIEVSPGAPRRAWLYVQAPPVPSSMSVSLEIYSRANVPVRRGDQWPLNCVGEGESAVTALVVGQDLADVRPWPSGTQLASSRGGSRSLADAVDSCPARKLPDSALGYHALDMVVLRDAGVAGLEPAQVDALRDWVHLGGYLVVIPSAGSAEIFRSSIVRKLAGDSVREPGAAECRLEDLYLLEGGRPPSLIAEQDAYDLPPEHSLVLLDPVQGRGHLEIYSAEAESGLEDPERARRLYAEMPCGAGRLGFLAFDDQVSRESRVKFLRLFWGAVLEAHSRSPRGNFARNAARSALPDLESELNDPSRDVGLPIITGLIGVYLFLIGPALYFVLKRKNRLPQVIWVEPSLAFLYLIVIFAVGYVTKGVLTKARVWTFISQHAGEALAVRESYLTIFSSSEETYRIDCPGGFLLRPVLKNEGDLRLSTHSRGAVQAGGGRGGKASLSLEDHKLAQWEQGHFVNLEVLDLEGQGVILEDLGGGSGPAGGGWRVRLRNRLSWRLLQGVAYGPGGRAFILPEVGPGEVKEETLGEGQDFHTEDGTSWKSLLKRISSFGGRGLSRGGRPRLAALLERPDEDFRVDKRSTLRERHDLFVLYDAGAGEE